MRSILRFWRLEPDEAGSVARIRESTLQDQGQSIPTFRIRELWSMI